MAFNLKLIFPIRDVRSADLMILKAGTAIPGLLKFSGNQFVLRGIVSNWQ